MSDQQPGFGNQGTGTRDQRNVQTPSWQTYSTQIVNNNLILQMTPENRSKNFITSQKLDCPAQNSTEKS